MTGNISNGKGREIKMTENVIWVGQMELEDRENGKWKRMRW